MNTSTTQIDSLDCAKHEERTRLIYEDIPGCEQPPFLELSTQDSLKAFEPLGVVLNSWSRGLLSIALRLSGVERFQRDTSIVESLLRSVNLRNNPFAPVMSATAAIADHPWRIEPLQRATLLLLAAKAVHRDLLSGHFRPDQSGRGNLEMGQYANLFSTHIIHDGRRFQLFKSTCTSQITVVAAKRVHLIDFGASGGIWTGPELLKALFQIAALSTAATSTEDDLSPTCISGAKPATQAMILKKLSKDSIAAQSLSMLRHSFVTLCLDLDSAPAPSSASEAAVFAHSRNFANRWYNSALQIVVFGNSKACLIFNFNAYLDGNIQMRAASEIWKRSTSLDLDTAADVESERFVTRELLIPLAPKLLRKARKDIISVLDNQRSTFEMADFGRSFFASRGLDPVATFVAALQLGISRLTGRTPHIRQLLTISKYRYMDLASASVTTQQMKRFLESMQNRTATRQQRRERLQAAIDSQLIMCRTARRYFPAFRLQALIAENTRGICRLYIKSIVKATKFLLRVMGLAHFGHDDIIISHPRIYDEVPVIGRPGVRLPYLRCFGLHYQILDRSIVLTWMPAVNWKITNAEMTNELVRALQDIADITESECPLDGQSPT
ncbi:MAG TPA: choline/carnitine O-acyltransferase [Bryobacteraceae bacterium]|nr:choline/carnitine O-acyltransferase [Bryobacteraceae bacterium]